MTKRLSIKVLGLLPLPHNFEYLIIKNKQEDEYSIS